MVYLNKGQVVEQFSFLIKTWKIPPFEYPYFIVEMQYMKFLLDFVKAIPIKDNTNIIPVVTNLLEQPLENAISQICRLMAQHKADGTIIWNLMDERKLILRQHQRSYNRQIPGKSPKGLTREYWEDYNHWMLALIYWNGYVNSQLPGFKVALPERADAPPEILLSEEYKPLWGMQAAFAEAGSPFISSSNSNNSIVVNPFASWERYKRGIANSNERDES